MGETGPAPNQSASDRSPLLRRWLGARIWRHVALLCIPVGIVAGLGAVLFSSLLDEATDLFIARGAGYVMPKPGAEGGAVVRHPPKRRWLLLFFPAAGGLITGILVYSLAPETEGHGTDAVIDAFHRSRGVIRKRAPIVKTIASVLTIGSGGSAGREGPIGQIGAGFASALASWLGASDRERRLLVLAGAGAGIGAVFRAPLGGAIFIAEVLYREIEFESAALVPAFIASIIAYSVYCSYYGVWGPIFHVPALQFNHPLELPLFVLLAVVCAGVGWVYVKFFYGLRDRVFRKIPLPNHVKPAIGGLAMGAIALAAPQALGMGYGWTQLALDGSLPLRIALAMVVVKIVATGLTISSGGSGGVFAPSIVIGGCLGMAGGAAVHHIAPGIPIEPAVFVLVGMAGFFAGVAKAPIASLVMVSEMTMGYGLLVPLMLTTAIAYLLVPRSASIYEKQVNSRVDSPAHEGEFARDVLELVRVKDALAPDAKPITFTAAAPLQQVLDAIVETRQQVYPIVDPAGLILGIIDAHDVRLFLTEHGVSADLLVAQDLCSHAFQTLTPQEDLASALRKFYTSELEELPVVESDQSPKVIGLLGRRQVIAAYHDEIARFQLSRPARGAGKLKEGRL